MQASCKLLNIQDQRNDFACLIFFNAETIDFSFAFDTIVETGFLYCSMLNAPVKHGWK